jgi:aspartate-semialdehyde dehydrogenase
VKKVSVAILGSGNIGTDLLIKVMRSNLLSCGAFIGRNLTSAGIQKAQALNVPVSAEGIDYIKKNPQCCDIVFDATSAASHKEHAPILEKLGKLVIDLTPAKIGDMCVPAVNLKECLSLKNVNMVTVADTGIGMKPDTIETLFAKFTRAYNANMTNIHGTGLGLYIARQIAEAHHGKVWAESDGEGKGSRFFVELEAKK